MVSLPLQYGLICKPFVHTECLMRLVHGKGQAPLVGRLMFLQQSLGLSAVRQKYLNAVGLDGPHRCLVYLGRPATLGFPELMLECLGQSLRLFQQLTWLLVGRHVL